MTAKESYFVGTNTTPLHVEEAIRQGIIGPDERLLGIFDGIFFDENNSRVGGLALNDFLVITDRRLTTWVRDQFKDYVDRFPLSHVFAGQKKNKDSLHGTLTLELALPEVAETEVSQASKLNLIFDFVPLLDLNLIFDLVEVMTNLNRDMIIGGADEKDRVKAASVMFENVFVDRVQSQTPGKRRNSSKGSHVQTHSNSSSNFDSSNIQEPVYEIVQGDDLEDMMTPLHRLGDLDELGSNRNVRKERASNTSQVQSKVASSLNPHYDQESRLWDETATRNEASTTYSQGRNSRFRQAANNIASRFESENTESDYEDRRNSAPKPPGVRLREDVAAGGPEGLYTIGRAGRAAWDGLEKLRREAESKSNSVIPLLQNLRDSGMNLNDMTEFVTALNNLLETLGSSPAAFELARSFINRSGGGGFNMHGTPPKTARPAKNPVRVEDAAEDGSGSDVDIPVASETGSNEAGKFDMGGLFGNTNKRKSISLRSSKRDNAPIVPEVDPADVAPVRHRVMVRGKDKSEELTEVTDKVGSPADDEIVMLFSKIDIPPLDGFDGIGNAEFENQNSDNLDYKLGFENEALAGGFGVENVHAQVVRSVPSGPELN